MGMKRRKSTPLNREFNNNNNREQRQEYYKKHAGNPRRNCQQQGAKDECLNSVPALSHCKVTILYYPTKAMALNVFGFNNI